ncbi:acyl-CoA thioesterase [Streptococcus tangpeifui]|uniref:acyl-CoA thioesterase n=1 Tax=Streptococcus tangpeifui TaxID=2709400 RepID=UPI0013ED7A17|nr:acyl-CoA thioesterase [Streptococcus sp. ZJ1593]
MKGFTHKVQYYETDRMGITHHSNYVRWMEEARVYFLDEVGLPYDKLEADGIISPVTAVDCHYKATSTFADVIAIDISVSTLKGAKLGFDYVMTNQNGQLVCQAHSEHSFLDKTGRFVALKKVYPDFYIKVQEMIKQG